MRTRLAAIAMLLLMAAPPRVGSHDPGRAQRVVYGRWLSLEGFVEEGEILSVIVLATPKTLCQQPPGIIWGLGPFSPHVDVYDLGDGRWKFSKIQYGAAYTLEGAFVDACKVVYHSNVLRFTAKE